MADGSTRNIIELLVTVKAVTLKFISGHGSAIPSAQKGETGSTYLVKI